MICNRCQKNVDPIKYIPEIDMCNSCARNEAGTPKELWDTLNNEYGFTVDICASKWNHKTIPYLTVTHNALGRAWDWGRYSSIWCNPPYNSIPEWLERALEPGRIVYLLPARTDRDWWRKWKPLAECHYIVGQSPHRRPQFDAPPGVKYSSNPMSCVLFIFGKDATPGKECYRSGLTGKRIT